MARPTKEPPIASSIVPVLVRHALARGLDGAALALRFDLPEDAARADLVTVAAGVPHELMHEVARAASEPDVALRIAAALATRRHKLVELAVRASANVGDALACLARWAPLIHEGLAVSLEESGAEARWVVRTPRRPRGLGRYLHELAVAHAFHEVRAGASEVVAASLWFSHARPPEVEALAAFFGARDVAFGLEDSGFALARADLQRPMRHADPRTVEAIAPLVDAELGSPDTAASFAARVAERIASTLPEGTEMAHVADRMHMSARTLQRRLEDEGTRFTEVLDRARLDVARRLLADPAASLGDVAFRLGFADLATFSRAFKRWTGKPPGQWRRS